MNHRWDIVPSDGNRHPDDHGCGRAEPHKAHDYWFRRYDVPESAGRLAASWCAGVEGPLVAGNTYTLTEADVGKEIKFTGEGWMRLEGDRWVAIDWRQSTVS